MVTQQEIARHVGLDVSSVNKILNCRPGPVFRKETIRRVFRAAKRLGFRFERLKHEHRRRHVRRAAREPVEIAIYKGNGTPHDRGQGMLEDISSGGARLGRVELPSGTLPLGPVLVVLQRKSELAPRRGQLVRVGSSGQRASFGIQFVD